MARINSWPQQQAAQDSYIHKANLFYTTLPTILVKPIECRSQPVPLPERARHLFLRFFICKKVLIPSKDP